MMDNWLYILTIIILTAIFIMFNREKSKVKSLEKEKSILNQDLKLWKQEAKNWYIYRAEKNDISAMLNLGSMYKNGAISHMNAARCSLDPDTNYAEALQCYQKAANLGSAEAMFQLGYMYHKGITPNLNRDYERAISWYRRASDWGHTEAREWLQRASDEFNQV